MPTDPINHQSATPARLTFGPVSLTLYPSDGAVVILVDPTAGYHIDFSYGQASGGTEQFCHKIVISRPLPLCSAPLPAPDAPPTAAVSRPIDPPHSAPTAPPIDAPAPEIEIVSLAEVERNRAEVLRRFDQRIAEFRREQERAQDSG